MSYSPELFWMSQHVKNNAVKLGCQWQNLISSFCDTEFTFDGLSTCANGYSSQ